MHGRLLAYILTAVLAPALALARPSPLLYVVGDSLSDQGNAFALTGGTFPPPPYDQRASNGPVAVEYLADALGVPLAPSAAGGTNYAVVGAATGAVAIPSLPPFTTENVAALLYGQAALEGTSLLTQAGDHSGPGPRRSQRAVFRVGRCKRPFHQSERGDGRRCRQQSGDHHQHALRHRRAAVSRTEPTQSLAYALRAESVTRR